jgi:hypothetical protein
VQKPLVVTYKRLQIKPEDIVNPHNFSYLLNPGFSACRLSGEAGHPYNKLPLTTSSGIHGHGQGQEGERHVDLLVYVHAAPSNLKKRQSIRATWGDRALLRK